MAAINPREGEPQPPMPDTIILDRPAIQDDLAQKFSGEPVALAVQYAALLSLSIRDHRDLYVEGLDSRRTGLLFGEYPAVVFHSLVGQMIALSPDEAEHPDNALGILHLDLRRRNQIGDHNIFNTKLQRLLTIHRDLSLQVGVGIDSRQEFKMLSRRGRHVCDGMVIDAVRPYLRVGQAIPDQVLDTRLAQLFLDPDYFESVSTVFDGISESMRLKYLEHIHYQRAQMRGKVASELVLTSEIST